MNPASRKIRVLLVDDHVAVRMGLALGINNQPDMKVVAEAENGTEALEQFARHAPDVVVLDLRMPKVNGIETIAELRRRFGSVRILILSSFAGGDEVSAALQAGALGFVGKDAPLATLLDAVRSVHRGEQVLAHELGLRLARRLSSQLSTRELDVLRMIGRGYSNKEISSKLGLAEGTVKGHTTAIFSKLGVSDRTQATITAIKRGLIHME